MGTENSLPIESVGIEFGWQFGCFVFSGRCMVDVDTEIGAKVVESGLRVGFVFQNKLPSLHAFGLLVQTNFCDPSVEVPARLGDFSYGLAMQAMVVEIGFRPRYQLCQGSLPVFG